MLWAESPLRSCRYQNMAVVSITNHYSTAFPWPLSWPVGAYISMSLPVVMLNPPIGGLGLANLGILALNLKLFILTSWLPSQFCGINFAIVSDN